MIPSDLFYAWLCAPTSSQRWDATQEIKHRLRGQSHRLALQMFWHERSPGLPRLETGLRKFWIKVAVWLHSLH
ncbi:MAG TPA: hypothetical protein V6D33_11915 [Cyanophyceae cyanobacterium]